MVGGSCQLDQMRNCLGYGPLRMWGCVEVGKRALSQQFGNGVKGEFCGLVRTLQENRTQSCNLIFFKTPNCSWDAFSRSFQVLQIGVSFGLLMATCCCYPIKCLTLWETCFCLTPLVFIIVHSLNPSELYPCEPSELSDDNCLLL